MCKNKFCPLHSHSYFSLLDGLSSPKDIVKRCKELELPAVALTDHGNIAGVPQFHEMGKKFGIQTISGIELYICKNDPTIKNKENDKRYHLTILGKGDKGFKTLMGLASETNRSDFFYRKPRISLEKLKNFAVTGDLLCLSGCLAGELSSSLFPDVNAACRMNLKKDEIKKMLLPNWKEIGTQIIQKYQNIFGKENYFIEIQEEGMIVQQVVIDCLRELAKDLGIKKVGTQDSHYTTSGDAEDQRILLYSNMQTTQEEQEKLKESDGDTMAFFHFDTFYIYGQKEAEEKYTEDEIENTLVIADMCKTPKIGRLPCLPKYGNENSNDIVRGKCIENAKTKLANKSKGDKIKYWNRLKYELAVIEDSGLADYFLIVNDACDYVDNNGGIRGKGRGSGAGCLVNYLLGITKIDPLEYDLYFERFYNASRNIPTHYDVGSIKFLSWLEANYDKCLNFNFDPIKEKVMSLFSDENKKNPLLIKELNWIDDNNKKMWLYILDMYNLKKNDSPNPSNSYVAYLLLMTQEYDEKKLLGTKDKHVSLPDIDTDINVSFRDKLIQYLINKWGEPHVAQMTTFGRLQGRAALKEVFRAQPDTVRHLIKVKAEKLGKNPETITERPIDIVEQITKHVPDEASITDELQQIREETGEENYGILQWAIDHIPEVKEAYNWYKPLFDQAIRLEGTKKNASKHAAGLVIASENISDLVPLTYDAKTKSRVCGFEMGIAEKCGCVKFDFLGIAALDKLAYAQNLINGVK